MISTPLWLWLSAAVFIPVIIHFWNKKSGKPRLLGTFRFLPDDTFSAARKIKLHELPLLLIRVLMVLVITALLAGIFWETEKDSMDELWVYEVEKTGNPKAEEKGNSIEIPSLEINEKGWWNILAQLDHQFQPKNMIVEGNFSAKNFQGERPEISAQVEWVNSDSLTLNEKQLAIWKSGMETNYRFFQYKSKPGVFSEVEAVDEVVPENSLQQLKSIRLILNTNNSEEINTGLKYAADYWNITAEERQLEEIARIESGGQTWILKSQRFEDGPTDFADPNDISGISFHVTDMDTSVEFMDPILTGNLVNFPILYEEQKDVLVINGEIEQEIKSWVYAGVGSYLIQQSLEIMEFLSPEIISEQREVISASGENKEAKERKSAGFWLFMLLALLWVLERWLAPKRGM
ncbi:MAG: BatA domain-containing protein [Balneolaceae bacterium]